MTLLQANSSSDVSLHNRCKYSDFSNYIRKHGYHRIYDIDYSLFGRLSKAPTTYFQVLSIHQFPISEQQLQQQRFVWIILTFKCVFSWGKSILPLTASAHIMHVLYNDRLCQRQWMTVQRLQQQNIVKQNTPITTLIAFTDWCIEHTMHTCLMQSDSFVNNLQRCVVTLNT